MSDKKFVLKITDKGAVENCHIFSTTLSVLLVMKREGKKNTLDEIKDECVSQLKKSTCWLKRPDDKTSSVQEKKEAEKMVVETLQMIEKLWETTAM